MKNQKQPQEIREPRGRIGVTVMGAVLAFAAVWGAGCASKLVRIDSEPGLAEIYINQEYVGKTPLYYRFRDRWQPWPVERKDDYTVTARFGPGSPAGEKRFTEVSAWPDIEYVPDEIIFTLDGRHGRQGTE